MFFSIYDHIFTYMCMLFWWSHITKEWRQTLSVYTAWNLEQGNKKNGDGAGCIVCEKKWILKGGHTGNMPKHLLTQHGLEIPGMPHICKPCARWVPLLNEHLGPQTAGVTSVDVIDFHPTFGLDQLVWDLSIQTFKWWLDRVIEAAIRSQLRCGCCVDGAHPDIATVTSETRFSSRGPVCGLDGM